MVAGRIALVALICGLAACDPGLHLISSAPDAAPDGPSADGPTVDAPPLVDPGPCSASGWCWITPQPTGNEINDLWANSASDIWAVGGTGTILHYDGSRWQGVAAGAPPERDYHHFNAIWASSATDVVVVGNYGAAAHFDGARWEELAIGTAAHLYGVWGDGGSTLIAVGAGEQAFHLEGGLWAQKRVGSAANGAPSKLNDLWGRSSSEVYAVGDGGLFARFDGKSWSTESGFVEHLVAIWGTPEGTLFVGALDGTVHERPAGLPFRAAFSVQNSLADLWAASSTDLYVAGSEGVTHYDGTTPTLRLSHSGLQAVGGASGQVFAAGVWGAIFQQQGTTFTQRAGSQKNFNDVWARSATEVYLATADGMLRYDGTALQPVAGISGRVTQVCGQPSGALVAVVSSSEIWRRAASASWQRVPGSITYPINELFCLAEGDEAFFAAWSGRVYQLSEETLTTHTLGTDANLEGLWGSSATNIYAVGQQGTIAHFDGTTWDTISGGSFTYDGIWGRSPTEIYIYADNRIYEHDGQALSSSRLFVAAHGISTIAGAGERLFAFDDWGAVYRRQGTQWIEEPRLTDWGPEAASVTADAIFGVGISWLITKP